MRRLPAVLLVGGLLSAPPLAAAPTAWEVAVPRAGLVRVALPAETWEGRDLEARGPAGEPVPARLVALGGASRQAARVTQVAAVAGGWDVVVDAGPSPPRHQGLRLPLAETGAATLELAASDDGATWRPLAAATLFRLGDGATLQRTVLEYPPVGARFLRLHWPAAAGFPKVSEVELDVVATRDDRREVSLGACSPAGPRHTRCAIAAVATPLRGLEVALPAGPAVGWRLRTGAGGAWEPAGEGTWTAAATSAPRRLPLPRQAGPLLLDLWGVGAAPRPTGLALLAAPLAVELQAAAPGTYRLLAVRGGPAGAPAAASAAEAQRLAPSPVVAPDAPPPPAPQGAPLPEVAFARSWPVEARAGAGELVKLELPPEVLAASAHGLADLRLAAADRQVPYARRTAPAPVRAARWADLVPERRADGVTAVALPLATGSPAGELVVRVGARPLRRAVRLVRSRAGGGGVARGSAPASAWTTWECRPLPPLPCEIALPVAAGEGELELQVADGDDAALPPLEAELWEPRQELWLRWPTAPVTLLAGAPGLRAPSYEGSATLAAVQPDATASLGAARDAGGAFRRWPRWALLAALGGAAAMLLLVLARALRAPADQPS